MTSCIRNPGSLRDLANRIRIRALSPVTLMEQCLDRIETVQPMAEPWREVDGADALKQSELSKSQIDEGGPLGPLHGIPVGIKDIIDVAGLPTRCNSPARQGVSPALADAEIVRQLRSAGAIILGKVHTTEFAYFDPSPCL